MVIEVSKKFLPSLAVGFSDPRVTLFTGDGAEYLRTHKSSFDVIIVDSSDPIGPAESLYQETFYTTMKEALKEGGIISTQAECLWLSLDLIHKLLKHARTLFPHADYAYTTIPTYPSGQIGFLVASLGDTCKEPKRQISAPMKYYNAEIHKAAFVLPEFAKKALSS